MPLAWQVDETFVVSPPQARAWLDAADDSAANLLGASHLLTTADAMTALARLTNDRDVRIAMLAEAQRWRTVRIGLDDKELARRRNVVEKIALPLRSGPYYVLGQSLLAAGRTDEGVAALMRVPIELADRRSLAAAALSDAAAALKAAGRHDEASAIARELEQRYRDETGSRRGGTIRLPLEPGQPRK
jgi:tetratricopeptide (TPR) repeat protein